MLLQWKDSYFKVRDKIESSGRDSRWEFDRRKLFDKTDHQALICNEIIKISIVLEEFYNIFGPELKAVTGEPKRIEEVLNRVRNLILKIKSVQFDIFLPKNFLSWQRLMEEFNHEVAEIEAEAKVFINQSFKKLRSAEGAFEMLTRFKNIRSREAINSEMMKKFTDILSQYCREVDSIFELFQKFKSTPPLYKNHPPVSGSIAWARFLFKSIKRPMLKFLTVNDLMNSEQGKEVKNINNLLTTLFLIVIFLF
jgi:dynein heavy chain